MKNELLRPISQTLGTTTPAETAAFEKRSPVAQATSEAAISKISPEIKTESEAFLLAKDLGKRLGGLPSQSIEAQRIDATRIEKLLSDD